MRIRNLIIVLAASLCNVAEARADIDLVGDIDGDGAYTQRDVRLLVDYLLRGRVADLYNGHEWVDLGLPSGRLWATMNVGATAPTEAGGYFAWGETEEKDSYTWDNYTWADTNKLMTRYCRDPEYGHVDSLSTLIAMDDAARQQWGGHWRMPTLREVNELRIQCLWTLTTVDGQKGYQVTGPNGNTLFLPLAGYREASYYANEGSEGTFWTSELNYATDNVAYVLQLQAQTLWWAIRSRYTGRTVRAVARSPKQIYDVNQDGKVSLADLTALVNLVAG